jgi:ferrous iron transport protein B
VRIALVGQPNSGKSTLFNAVAGYRSLTSNFAGTTVDYTLGRARLNGEVAEVVDLPGLYSLSPANPAEACTRKFLLAGEWDVLVNIVDASQLSRSLELTLELRDLEAPLVVCLNMMDEAGRKGMVIDASGLSAALGVPVVEAIAARGQGIIETFHAALELGRSASPASTRAVLYPQGEVEAAVQALAGLLPEVRGTIPMHRAPEGRKAAVLPAGGEAAEGAAACVGGSTAAVACAVAEPVGAAAERPVSPSPRFRALHLLQTDPQHWAELDAATGRAVEAAQGEIVHRLGQPADAVISSARHAACLNLFEQVVRVTRPHADWREQIDRLLMHPVWGYVFLAGVFGGFFSLVFDLGKLGETRILALFDQLIAYLGQSMVPTSAAFALAKGALLGTAGAVAIVLPYLLPFLIGLAVLEDLGYLARVGYLMDALMHRLGLHGTATLPVLLGYGCSVPAVMATRILTSRRDRFVASFLAVLVPCSARMTVILALVGFYLGAFWALGIYILNLAVVALAGSVLAKIWPEISPGMLMEVPPYHRPSPRVVLLKTWWRLREFVVIAVPLLIVGSALLGLIEFFGWQSVINAALSPLMALLGLPAAVGLTLIFGVLRKELSLLMLMQALGTTDVHSVMTSGQIIIFTLFVTFYLPCLATLASMVRELGRKLTAAAAGSLLALAILIAVAARGIIYLFH